MLCDAKKLCDGAVAFITLRPHQHNAAWLEQFATAVQQIPEIVEVYRMTGEIDDLLRVVVRDIQGPPTTSRRPASHSSQTATAGPDATPVA